MPHIVIDARIIATTTGRYVERLLHYIDQLDQDNDYTVLVRKKDQNYWQPTNPRIHVKIADFKPYSFSEQFSYYFMLRKLNADLVHFTIPHAPVLYRGKKVITIHDLTLLDYYNPDKNWLIYHFKQLIGRFVFWWDVRSGNRIVTISNYIREELLRRYKPSSEKIITTHLAGELRTEKQTPYPVPSRAFILFVGQQSAYKNINRLIDAAQQLLKNHPDLWLVLAGKIDSAAERTKNHIEKTQAKQVLMTDYIDDDQLNWLYANARCYVFPSLSEGFGLPGLEAILHNTPLVSSSSASLPEVYGDAALYFDPIDTQQMASVIEKVISNDTERQHLIEKGKIQIKKYSWQKTAEQTLEIYKNLLEE